MSISVLIIDDVSADLKQIEKTVNEETRRLDISVAIDSFQNACDEVYKKAYDLVILDIQLQEIKGFEVAEKIKERYPSTVIIYCSDHNELVFQSFSFNVFFFVRKEYLKDDMRLALQMYKHNYGHLFQSYQLDYNGEKHSLLYSNIIYIHKEVNDYMLHLNQPVNGKKQYRNRGSLKKLIQTLPGSLFLQPSQSDIVNVLYIERIDNDEVIMNDDIRIHISRDRKDTFKSGYYRLKEGL